MPDAPPPPSAPHEPSQLPNLDRLRTRAVISGIAAAVVGVVNQIEPDRQLGTTEFPHPAIALGAAIGSFLAPLIVAIIMARLVSFRFGLVAFVGLASLVTLFGLVQLYLTWSFKF